MAVRLPETLQSVTVDREAEQIVAELGHLGVSYLSRQVSGVGPPGSAPLPRAELLAAIVRQPSARVRAATISLLLAQPSSCQAVDAALSRLESSQRPTLMHSYSAAVQLQRMHESKLRAALGSAWVPIPYLFAKDLGFGESVSPESRLAEIALSHGSRTGTRLNWDGTYRQAADRFLRQWELEAQWSR